MRAVVMRTGRLVLEDVPDPVPTTGEIVASSLACGLRGSDLHALKRTREMVASVGYSDDVSGGYGGYLLFGEQVPQPVPKGLAMPAHHCKIVVEPWKERVA